MTGNGNTDVGLKGKLLIAMPHMDDSYFQESVILMTEHSADGAMGFVLNALTDSVTLAEMLDQLNIKPGAKLVGESMTSLSARTKIRAGGPCNESHGFVIHRHSEPGRFDASTYEGCEEIDGNYAFTVSTDVLRDIAGGTGPGDFIVSLGYAGWGPGQLDKELHENAWLHSDASEALVFGCDPETLWQSCFTALGIEPTQLSAVAGRA